MTKEEAEVNEKNGVKCIEDAGRGYRIVVASPMPKRIRELETIKTLVGAGHIVITCGGGGIPVADRNGKLYDADITEIGSMIDQATGLFAVKACVNAPDESLLTGCSVKVIAETYSQDNALLIPYDAVYYDDSQPYVYVAVNNIVERRDIETGIFDENTMTVMSGLTAEDQLITSWSANLRDGAEISILTDEQTAETAMVPDSVFVFRISVSTPIASSTSNKLVLSNAFTAS